MHYKMLNVKTPNKPSGCKLLAFLLCATTGLLAAWAETIDGTPDSYIDYIESTGAQYIDTGVNAETGLKARADFSWGSKVNNYDDWGFLGANDGYSGDNSTRMLMIHIGGDKHYIGYGLKSLGYPGNAIRVTRNVRGEILVDFSDYNALQIYQNGSNTMTSANQEAYAVHGNVTLNLNLYAFAYNQAGTAGGKCKAKLYELKIMKKNASGGFDILRHYLPCLKNGRAALYDKANGKIYFSDSGTDFLAGSELPRPAEMVEWVQSNNKDYNWLDTLVYAKSGLRSEVDFIHKDANQISGHTDVDRCVLGARITNTGAMAASRFYLTYFYQGVFCYGYRNLYYKDGANVNEVSAVNGSRYLVESDLSAGNQSVTVNGTELHKDGVAHDETYFATGNDLSLFAMHLGTGHTCHSAVRLFYAKIWDGDELLRDFAPCVDSTGKAGLYDGVTERIFYLGENKVFDPTNCVGGVTNWLLLADGTLPDAKISYIESDGTNDYFDVGVIAKDGVEMEAVMEWLTVPKDGAFVSARTDTPSIMRFFPYHYWGGYHRLGYAGEGFAYGGAATAGQKYKVVTHYDAGNQTASISALVNGAWSDVGSISKTLSGPVDTGLSLYLFARNYNNSADYPGHARMYKLKFREKQQDGTYKLTRDFVPVMKDGKAMLYDRVSGTFFRNKGRYLAIGGGSEREWFEGGATIVIR